MQIPFRKTLVTGGAGFIGSHLVRQLVAVGCTVRVLDNLSTGSLANLGGLESDIDFRLGDIRDQKECERAVDGVEVVFHVAALPSVARSLADPISTHESNVTGTLRLLEACRNAGVRRVVYSSSSSVYGDTSVLPKQEAMEPLPRSPYAASKLAAEQYVLAYARAGLLEGVALRYFNVYGPRQSPDGPYAAIIPIVLEGALRESAVPLNGDGRQSRDFTFVEDVVRANTLAAEAANDRVNGVVLNVGAGQRASLLELVAIAQRVTGREIVIHHVPPRPGDVRDSQADVSRIRAALAYAPSVSLEEGLRRTWTWMNGAAQRSVAAAAEL